MNKNDLQPALWVDRYADYLFNYARSRVGEEELAKDLVQDTFISALKSAANFKGNASERTWLVAILKRKVIDHYRKSNTKKGKAEVRMSFIAESGQEGEWLETRVPDPESMRLNDRFENDELALAIHECITQLPEKHGEAFTLKTIEGWSTEDICNEMEINPTNFWVMIHRARTALIACLNQSWFKNT